MSTKDRPITFSYQKKKNSQGTSSNKSQSAKKDVKPSTSTALFEKDMTILKNFDLNWEFGPSMGITRLERWNRAEKHGLNPDPEVKQLVSAHLDDDEYTQCLWNYYKNIM